MTTPIRICIVDDMPEVRDMLGERISAEADLLVVASLSSAGEAARTIPRLRPDLVLMDINLGYGPTGIDCIRELREAVPATRFLVCTVFDDDRRIFGALAAGAHGYLLKSRVAAEAAAAIRETCAGGAPMSREVALRVVDAFRDLPTRYYAATATPVSGAPGLTVRENEILDFLSQGFLYKEIAAQLFISTETVRKHVYHIYDKMHVNNRVEAINRYRGW